MEYSERRLKEASKARRVATRRAALKSEKAGKAMKKYWTRSDHFERARTGG